MSGFRFMEDEHSTGIVAWTDNLLPGSIGLSLVPLMTHLFKYCSLLGGKGGKFAANRIYQLLPRVYYGEGYSK